MLANSDIDPSSEFDSDDESCLQIACNSRNINIVELLLHDTRVLSKSLEDAIDSTTTRLLKSGDEKNRKILDLLVNAKYMPFGAKYNEQKKLFEDINNQ